MCNYFTCRQQREFGGLKLIVISRALENKEFLYIEREESILCPDQTGLYYLMIYEAELYHCKITKAEWYVCIKVML